MNFVICEESTMLASGMAINEDTATLKTYVFIPTEEIEVVIDIEFYLDGVRVGEKFYPDEGILLVCMETNTLWNGKKIFLDRSMTCPRCGKPLSYFSGLESIPDFHFCQYCNDTMYSDEGKKVGDIE